MPHLKHTLAGATLALLVSFSPAAAQAEGGDSRAVISSQLEAFLAGDFATAYAFASDDIKKLYPTLDGFMSMVKSGYLPVLRPGNYAFGRTEEMADGRIVHEVLIRAPDGSDWTAVYFMELQEDGVWKIDGVNLRKGAAGMT